VMCVTINKAKRNIEFCMSNLFLIEILSVFQLRDMGRDEIHLHSKLCNWLTFNVPAQQALDLRD